MNIYSAMNAMNMSSDPSETSSPLHSQLDYDISPLTSPWLGAKMTGSSLGAGGSHGRDQAYGHHHSQSQYHEQHPHSSVQAANKRYHLPLQRSMSMSFRSRQPDGNDRRRELEHRHRTEFALGAFM